MLFQERQRKPVQPREVLAPILLAEPRLVLAKCHVQTPVTAVLDTPVPPSSSGEPPDVQRQTADVVADFHGLLPVSKAAGGRHCDRLQPVPPHEPGKLLGGRKLEISSQLLTT